MFELQILIRYFRSYLSGVRTSEKSITYSHFHIEDGEVRQAVLAQAQVFRESQGQDTLLRESHRPHSPAANTQSTSISEQRRVLTWPHYRASREKEALIVIHLGSRQIKSNDAIVLDICVAVLASCPKSAAGVRICPRSPALSCLGNVVRWIAVHVRFA